MLPVIDSNILIYAFSKGSPAQAVAEAWLKKQMETEGFAVSQLSLIEFYQVATDTRKVSAALTPAQATAILAALQADAKVKVLELSNMVMKEAIRTAPEYGIKRFGIYDHLLAVSCKIHGHGQFVTRNTADFVKYHFLELINPFG